MNVGNIVIGTFFLVLAAILLVFLTIPIWSDSKKVCEYWEKQNSDMVCIHETTYFCLGRC